MQNPFMGGQGGYGGGFGGFGQPQGYGFGGNRRGFGGFTQKAQEPQAQEVNQNPEYLKNTEYQGYQKQLADLQSKMQAIEGKYSRNDQVPMPARLPGLGGLSGLLADAPQALNAPYAMDYYGG
jgi:hypothetical protein